MSWEEEDDDTGGEDEDYQYNDSVQERRSMIVNECMESLVVDKKRFCNKHCFPMTDAFFWAPTFALRQLQPW